jgi:hypothetical protein
MEGPSETDLNRNLLNSALLSNQIKPTDSAEFFVIAIESARRVYLLSGILAGYAKRLGKRVPES